MNQADKEFGQPHHGHSEQEAEPATPKPNLTTITMKQGIQEIGILVADAVSFYTSRGDARPPFCLIVFTEGETQYLSNALPEVVLEKLKDMVSTLEVQIDLAKKGVPEA